MASNAPQECCVKLVKHEGKAEGAVASIGPKTEAYVSGDKKSKKAIVIFTDVFGHQLINTQLIADSFAKQGYFVVVPDLFNGDAYSGADFSKLGEWFPHHGPETVQPNVQAAITWLSDEIKPDFIGAVGYCFGAKWVIRLLVEGSAVAAGAIAHPSQVSIEEVAQVRKPLAILGAEQDPIYTPELRDETEKTLKENKVKYFTTEISGVFHGFAVRGDLSDKWLVTAKEKVFSDILWWFSLFQ